MKKVVLIARLLLGLVFTVFGLNGFFQFLPMPEPSEAGGAFLGALAATGYMLMVLKLVEVISGVLLLVGRFVPLALTLLAPIIVNIVLYHVFLDTSGLPMAILILVLEIFLAWAYRGSFRGVLEAGAQPTA